MVVPQVLCKYRSGKLPKAFKIIPALSNWEQVLYLTEPEKWSAAAMYQATRCDTHTRAHTKCCLSTTTAKVSSAFYAFEHVQDFFVKPERADGSALL